MYSIVSHPGLGSDPPYWVGSGKRRDNSSLGSNTGMVFHPANDLHQCVKMVRLLFGFVDLVKNSGGCLFTD